jgi:DHA1 family inner membrane transport protein
MNLPLIALFLAAFAFGTAEFVVAGILPEVADGLGVAIPTAGTLITAYAVGIAIGGPALAILTKNLPRKALILGLGSVFTLGQVFCALAPNLAILLVARILVATVHGTYFGIAMVVAIGLVPPARRGFAVALILAGLTISNIIGVPLGTALGTAWGWRATFWGVGLVGLAATLLVAVALPPIAGKGADRGSFMRELRVLGRQQIVTSLAIAVLAMIGQYSLFTYISPLLREVTGLSPQTVPWLLLLYGVGSTAGVFIGGKLADWKLMPSLIGILGVLALVYLLIAQAAPYPLAMSAAVIVWGGLAFAFGSPVQSRVLTWTADAPNLASTLMPAAFNVGIAIAAGLGGWLIETGLDYRDLAYVGCIAMLLAALVAILSSRIERRSGAIPPAPAPAA